ncbi:hypothetical protein ACSBR1_043639 [Camellia fascicularis]
MSKRRGWIPMVKQRGKEKVERKVDSAAVFNVFMDNLPSSLDPKGLFNLFRKFGVVKDIFIPQKRRRNTNTRFGFVRYNCEVAAKVAVQKAHGLWVDNKKEQEQIHFQPPKQPNPSPEVRRDRNHFTSKKSFADVGRGSSKRGNGSIVKAEEYSNRWLYDSVVVRLKARYVNISLKIELKERGIDGFEVHKGGGKDVVLSFKSKEVMETKMKAIKTIIEDLCEDINQWRPELTLAQERPVWISCYGIPLHLWNRSNLIKIGSLWGEVIEEAEYMSQALDYGKLRIITKCMEPINQVIYLEAKQSSYLVRVWKDQHQDVEEDHSSNEVRGTREKDDSNGAGDGEPSQNHIVESTQRIGGESAQGLEQHKIEARGEQTCGNENVADVVRGSQ